MTLRRQEPDAGLGNGGLGRLAACFIDSLATLANPGHRLRPALRIRHVPQEIEDGCQVEQPDNWLRRPDPWEVVRPTRRSRSSSTATFQMQDGRLTVGAERADRSCWASPTIGRSSATAARPSTPCGSGAPASPDDFNFLEFSRGDFFDAVHEKVGAENLTRVLYPDDSTAPGRNLRFVQEYFLVACSLADIVARFRRGNRLACPARQGRHPAERHPSVDGRRRADAHSPRSGPPRLGRRLGPDRAHAGLHQPHAAARGPGEMAGRAVRDD